MNPTKSFQFTTLCFILSVFAITACETTSSSQFEPITVSGTVTDRQQNPIENAIVRITDPRPERFTTTNADGAFSFTVDVDSSMTFTIDASKEGFVLESQTFVAIPERDVSLPSFRLRGVGEVEDDNDDGDNGDDDDPGIPGGPAAAAASIYLEGISSTDIGVRGTGQKEDTRLLFQVVDENGNPLSASNAVDVSFRFGNHPDGGEELTEGPITTNENGQAVTTLISGTVAGTVQVVAEFTRADGSTVRSQPVSVVIHAGLPSQDHLSLLFSTRNAAFGTGTTVTITALAGDRYGNTVPDGTAIYFTTNGGFINGSAFTTNGRATAQLSVSNPFPPNGFATITASTANDEQQNISLSSQMIFSLSPIIEANPTTFNIPNDGDQEFTYTVRDVNGNPMVQGTSITVTVESDAFDVLGDVNVQMREPGSALEGLAAFTTFNFTIRDTDEDIDDVPVVILIESEGPNGYGRLRLTGRKLKELPD